jgi:hypothetical protein
MLLDESERAFIFTLDHRIEARNELSGRIAITPAERTRTRLSRLLGWHADFRRSTRPIRDAHPAVEASAAMFATAQKGDAPGS